MTVHEALQQGAQAFFEGKQLDENPHLAEDPNHAAWATGWRLEEEQAGLQDEIAAMPQEEILARIGGTRGIAALDEDLETKVERAIGRLRRRLEMDRESTPAWVVKRENTLIIAAARAVADHSLDDTPAARPN